MNSGLNERMAVGMESDIVQKAFAVVEAIDTLEKVLWELFYEEFLTICAEKSEERNRMKGVDNLVEF
jgi:hypothetical protein